nr:hypothetical protein I308_04832 [Cryptococcus tetragattii IND107]
MHQTPHLSGSGSPPRPNLDDFQKEAMQKLIWRNERKMMLIKTLMGDGPHLPGGSKVKGSCLFYSTSPSWHEVPLI